ncbi:MAG: DUF2147 domain-containing protein [Cytophagales bacterium]
MKKRTYLFSFILLLNITVFAQKPDDICKTWLTGKKEAKIKIEKGIDGKYNGKIVWLKTPNNPDGTPKVDKENPDKEKRKNPIMGLPLLKGFEYKSGNVWENGTIYDPESGKTYSCVIKLTSEGNLDVRGYVGFSWIGRTDTWTASSE